jgi:hypothetical protein
MPYVSWLSHWAMRWGVRIYTYPCGTPSIGNHSIAQLSPGGADGIPGGGGAAWGVCSPDTVCLQSVCGFCAMPFSQGREQSIWFHQPLSDFFRSQPSPGFTIETQPPTSSLLGLWHTGVLISCCVSSVVAQETPPLAILAIFKATHILAYSGCTWPPCLALVANLVKTY